MAKARKIIMAGIILGIAAMMIVPANGIFKKSNPLQKDRILSNELATSTSLNDLPPPKITGEKPEIPQKDISSIIKQNNFLGNSPVATTDEPEIHPTLAADKSGWLFGGYTLQHSVLDSDIVLTFSKDGGVTWESTNVKDKWGVEGKLDYPAIDYWDSDNTFVTTFTPDSNDCEGSALYVIKATDPSDPGTWNILYQDCSMYIYERESGDIAGYSSDIGNLFYGVVATTADTDYSGSGYVPGEDIPCVNFDSGAGDGSSYTWWFSWTEEYGGSYQNCHHACVDINKQNGMMYAAWDYYDDDAPEKKRDILLATGNIEEWLEGNWNLSFTILGGNEENTYPDIAVVENGYIYIVAQENVSSTENQDIICYYSHDSGKTWEKSTIAADSDKDEMYPSIAAEGERVNCIFTVDGDLYVTNTDDGGVTWNTPEKLNDVDGTVVGEYRTASACNLGAIWMDNRNGNYDIYFDTLGAIPIIGIKEISGGFGIKSTVENTGTADAADLMWGISVEAPLILFGGETTDTIDNLPVGDEEQISSFVFGFGNCVITVTANGAKKTANGFLLGPLVLNVE